MSPTKPTILIATDTPTFDIEPWAAEGYSIHLLTHATVRGIEDAADDLESNDKYGIIAFGTAATAALQFAIQPSRQLQCVAAYYPPTLPRTNFQPGVQILLHLPSDSPFSTPASPSLRIRLYSSAAGFADGSAPSTYNRISASLAFSRTLALLRDCIGSVPGPGRDLEALWDGHLLAKFSDRDAAATTSALAPGATVLHVPTLTGASGEHGLKRFYDEFFIPGTPPSLRITLVSRTVGADRIVDEVVVSFRHTCEIPWMLPGVEPTGREVEVPLVTVVAVRAGRLVREHVYWDQASVLVQVGLLERGTLPVVGAEAARKVLDERVVEGNKLIKEW